MRARVLVPLLFLPLIAAKGGKKKDDAPAPPPPPAPPPAAEAPPAEPEAPPAPEAPKVVKNIDMKLAITTADGAVKSGHVTGLERTIDFQGDQGWSSDAKDLKLTVESGSSEKQVAWTDVKSITITPGKMPDDVDCTYSSDFNPWMYQCDLRTTSAVVLKDGSKGNITNPNHWRFTFEDGSTYEMQVYKYTVREQDEHELQFGEEASENAGLYTKLQQQIRTDLKGKIVKSVTVQ
jgi:hypothetical protein